MLTVGALSTAQSSPPFQNSTQYEGDAESENFSRCTVFDPPDPQTSIEQCTDVCGTATAAAIKAGNVSSVTCIGPTSPYQKDPGGGKWHVPS